MACVAPFSQFTDESFALQLQLEEIEAQRELQTGKWAEYSPPGYVAAYDDWETELQRATMLLEDFKFADSIARAVDSDAIAIDEIRLEETQSIEDRAFALSLNEGEDLSIQDITDLQEIPRLGMGAVDWDDVLRATAASTFSIESDSTIAGPSTPYHLRQKVVLDHLSQRKAACTVCMESFYPQSTVRLDCNHVYCKSCLKDFFLRAAKDETLFPPKCCRIQFDISIIGGEFSADELADYPKL